MVKPYDAKQVLITLGAIPISGFADGSFVKIENNEDAFTLQIGTDGEGTRSRTNNDSATVTFTLMQSSLSNDLLSALHNLDKTLPGGGGIVPLLIKDLSGRSLYLAQTAWIKKRPSAEFGREAGPREWVVETDKLIPFDAGN